MSNSSLVNVKVPAYNGNYTVGRSGRKIELIAIHHMAGILSAKQCGAIFQKAGRKGSSNYGIGKDGDIALYVDESDTSWCNSNWDSNCKSVTIETSNCEVGGNWKVSDTVLNKLIELVADIAKRNNLGTIVKGKNLVWHSMYTATSCPGPYLLSKLDYICEKANEINNTIANTTNYLPNLSNYKGSSIVDALNSIGYDSSFANRKILANKLGISNYTGTAEQNLKMISLLKGNTSNVTYLKNSNYKGTSIVEALNQIKIDSSYNYRAKLAEKNGISNYTGTASQNTQMLNLLKNGKLVKA